jgi:hypothetical protein
MGFHEIQKDLMGFLRIFGWLSWLKEHLGFMAIITIMNGFINQLLTNLLWLGVRI